MTSKASLKTARVNNSRTVEPTQAYVWVWLPEATEPVVAGRLSADGELTTFTYGQSYLRRADAQPIFPPELPLVRGAIRPEAGLSVAGCIRDARPGCVGSAGHPSLVESDALTRAMTLARWGLLTYLLEPQQRLDAGEVLSPALAEALLRGTSIGGARPKALIRDDPADRQLQRVAVAGDVPIGTDGAHSRALAGDARSYNPVS